MRPTMSVPIYFSLEAFAPFRVDYAEEEKGESRRDVIAVRCSSGDQASDDEEAEEAG
jgi:hypothetical protein